MDNSANSGGRNTSPAVMLTGAAIFFICLFLGFYFTDDREYSDAPLVIEGFPEIREFAVLDMSGVLSQASHDYFNRESRNLQQTNGSEIFVVTMKTLPEYDSGRKHYRTPDINELATLLFNEIGLGSSQRNNGALILFTTHTPHAVLRTGSGLESCISDGKAGRILDDYAVDNMRAGQWNNAAIKTWNAVAREIYRCYRNEIPGVLENSRMKIREEASGFYGPPLRFKDPASSSGSAGLIFVLLAVIDFLFMLFYGMSSAGSQGGGRRIGRGSRFSGTSHHGGSSGSGRHGGGRTRGGGASR